MSVERDREADAYLGTFSGVHGDVGENPDTMGRLLYLVTNDDEGYQRRTEAPLDVADLVSSELPNGMHAPCIDLDFPAKVVASSTPGHSHLYIDKELTWDEYVELLKVFARAGLIEEGYLRASLTRRGTHLRLPWVRKP